MYFRYGGVFVFMIALAFSSHAADRRPNVVLIMADDIGFECYGAYGSTHYETPRFDALASSGARFLHAYSQPVCTPSRVKIMTGKYNFRNYTTFGELDLGEPTFATMLQKAGYRTAVAGKWQLTAGNLKGPNQAGFDEYCLWHFMFDKALQDGAVKRGADPQFLRKGSRYRSPVLYRDGVEMAGLDGKYGPDVVTDYICEFLERNKDNPFFLYYPMMLVHAPFEPTPDSADWIGDTSAGESPRDKRGPAYFKDMVAYMDKCIGRIVDQLDALGLRENTLILVTGDNGTGREIESPFPERGSIRGGKHTMTDAGTRVGFVANWLGVIKAGTVVSPPIDFADVLPTIAEVTGASPIDPVDGQSFLPLLKGDETKARPWVFMSSSSDGPPFEYFVRDVRWKLYGDGRLYDVPNDWLEEHPASGPDADAARGRLQPILDQILAGAR